MNNVATAKVKESKAARIIGKLDVGNELWQDFGTTGESQGICVTDIDREMLTVKAIGLGTLAGNSYEFMVRSSNTSEEQMGQGLLYSETQKDGNLNKYFSLSLRESGNVVLQNHSDVIHVI